MENKELLQHILPKEFVEYFDLISITEKSDQLIIKLDECFLKPPEHSDKELESKGFSTPIQINDFPIRNNKVLLHVRRRKWKDKKTGTTIMRKWDLKQDGTNYTKEFAAFLKKMFR